MAKDKFKTDVKFLVNNKDETKDVFAFFPKEQFTNIGKDKDKLFTGYAHIGQHSAVHIDYANESRAATKEEREPLVKEIESIGYNLNVIN